MYKCELSYLDAGIKKIDELSMKITEWQCSMLCACKEFMSNSKNDVECVNKTCNYIGVDLKKKEPTNKPETEEEVIIKTFKKYIPKPYPPSLNEERLKVVAQQVKAARLLSPDQQPQAMTDILILNWLNPRLEWEIGKVREEMISSSNMAVGGVTNMILKPLEPLLGLSVTDLPSLVSAVSKILSMFNDIYNKANALVTKIPAHSAGALAAIAGLQNALVLFPSNPSVPMEMKFVNFDKVKQAIVWQPFDLSQVITGISSPEWLNKAVGLTPPIPSDCYLDVRDSYMCQALIEMQKIYGESAVEQAKYLQEFVTGRSGNNIPVQNEKFDKYVQMINDKVNTTIKQKEDLEQVMRDEAERQASGSTEDITIVLGDTIYYFTNFLNRYNFISMIEYGKTPSECMQFVDKTEPVEE